MLLCDKVGHIIKHYRKLVEDKQNCKGQRRKDVNVVKFDGMVVIMILLMSIMGLIMKLGGGFWSIILYYTIGDHLLHTNEVILVK